MFWFFSIISDDNLGLQTSSDRRPHVVDRNHHISLHTNAQRKSHLSFLEPVLSGGSQERQGCIKEVTVVIGELKWTFFCQKWVMVHTSFSHSPAPWWRSLSLQWGRRKRAGSRCAACWSRALGSSSGTWSSRAWSVAEWASLTPCYTHNLCTCVCRQQTQSHHLITGKYPQLHLPNIFLAALTFGGERRSSHWHHW